jgi:hypothetical protein
MDAKQFAERVFAHLCAVRSILRTEKVNQQKGKNSITGRGYSTSISGMGMEIVVEVGFVTHSRKDGVETHPFINIIPNHTKETNPLLLLMAKLFLNELFPLKTSFGPMSAPYTPEYSSWDYFVPIIGYDDDSVTPEEVAEITAKELAYFQASMRGVADTNYTAEYPERALRAIRPVLTEIMGDAKSRANGRIASNPMEIRYD